MNHEPVKTYYNGFGEREWERLKRPDDGFVEYAVTRKNAFQISQAEITHS